MQKYNVQQALWQIYQYCENRRLWYAKKIICLSMGKLLDYLLDAPNTFSYMGKKCQKYNPSSIRSYKHANSSITHSKGAWGQGGGLAAFE